MIDVLKKIDDLRIQRGWSIYKLAEEAELTESTIANMFARKTLPSIKTLEAICNAFKITLSEFFADENEKSIAENASLLNKINKLNDRDKTIIKNLINLMSEQT